MTNVEVRKLQDIILSMPTCI